VLIRDEHRILFTERDFPLFAQHGHLVAHAWVGDELWKMHLDKYNE